MTALENRRRKARALAVFLYRRDMTVADVLTLPRSATEAGSPDIETQNTLARAAYTEAGVDEAVPHGPGSQTWGLTADLLAWMNAHPDDERVPVVDLTADRSRWILLTEDVTEEVQATIEEVAQCSAVANPSDASAADTRSEPTTSMGAAPTGRTLTEVTGDVPAVGDWPSDESGTCARCGARHRRYGLKGGGALCPKCRAVALGTSS